MCGGVEYYYNTWQSQMPVLRQAFYSQTGAALPVLKDGVVTLCQWGLRDWDMKKEVGPRAGSVEYAHIDGLYWKMYKPEEVLIPAQRFSTKETSRRALWEDIPQGAYILGVKIVLPAFSVVYVVTQGGQDDKNIPYLVNKSFKALHLDI